VDWSWQLIHIGRDMRILFWQCQNYLRGLLICAVSCLPWISIGATTAQEPVPNIIFILSDDLGYGDLQCYGQEKIKTPNIDKLAAEGIRFTDFYAGSTVCAPSRDCLMTGFHTGHATIRGNGGEAQALTPQDLTVAQLLKQAGYHTGLVGKWGLGGFSTTGSPTLKGFDEFAGYLSQVHAHDYYTDHLFRYDSRTGFEGREELPENREGKHGLYTPDMFTDAALNFARINKPNSKDSRQHPFFLFLSYIIPHANDEEGARTGNGMQVPSDAPYSKESWPQVEKNKAAMITRMDGDIGKLMAKLKDLKLDDNTLVFFSSDNGPHKEGGVDPKFFKSSGPLQGIKRDLYEGGIRVPLIARWPGKIKPGQVSSQVCAFWDFLPTVAQITRTKPPANLDGISIVPTLLGQTQTNQHDFLYWEFHERGSQQAVRMGDWKGLRLKLDGPLELYNLKADIGEKQNVADKNPEVVAKIEAYLKTARTDSPAWPMRNAPKKKAGKAAANEKKAH
jgi:arylsulfatase A-like enzyme